MVSTGTWKSCREHKIPTFPQADHPSRYDGKKTEPRRLKQRNLTVHRIGSGLFLAYAGETEELRAVFEALVAELGKVKNRPRLVERTLLTPLHLVQSFLAYAGETKELRAVFEALVAELGNVENRPRLVERALLTPLQFVSSFLAYAENTKELRAVFEALVTELGNVENRPRLVERALLAPLGNLQSFLAYAEHTKELRAVFEALVAELGNVKNRPRLVEQFATPLNFVSSFLAYAENTKELRAVFEALVAELGNVENRPRLVERALLTSLGDLQSFLAYAENTRELRAVFEALVAELGNVENRPHLVERFATAPLAQLVSILSGDTAQDLWSAVLLDVDEEEWERNRLRESESDLNAFVRFQKLATVKARPTLTSAPALTLVRKSDLKQWHRQDIGLHHLSHVIRCATNATDEESSNFLERIATADWIDHQIREGASTGGLAGSLLALSTRVPPNLRALFLRSSLRDRLIKEIAINPSEDFGAWAATISLLGAAAALGLRLDSTETHWPDHIDLTSILELRTPKAEWTVIGPLQVQLWLGLREMVRLRQDVFSVPSEQGERILKLWRAARDDETHRFLSTALGETNARMVGWLETCRANGWRLIKDVD